MFDLAIIGGGPAGYVAAERAGAKGLSVVLFEKKELGGVCLNEGCIPTKTMLYSAKLFDYAKYGDKYGINVPEVSFDYGKIITRKNKVVRRLVVGINSKLKANNINIVKGNAYIKGKKDNGFEIECNDNSFMANKVLICTGSETLIPNIPGIQEAGNIIVTNKEILSSPEQPKSLVIIGGGVIGMEFASFFNSLGTTVHVVEMMPEILGNIDKEIGAMLRDIYTKKGVNFHLSCKVTAINKNDVIFEKADGQTVSISGDKILVSVGRRPVTTGLGIENIGIELNSNAIKIDNKMRTNIEGVFAAGDVTGFSMLAHTASMEGEVIINNLTGEDDEMHYNAIPSIVYTNPEVASVGLSAEDAINKGFKIKEHTLPMSYSGRFVAENEGGNGLCKIISELSTGRIIGVHMIGNPCSEIIFGAGMAIKQNMTIEGLQKNIFPHPTISEILKEVAFTNL